jgi:hypothetical protein
MKLLILHRMDPPQFKEKVPHAHSLKIENVTPILHLWRRMKLLNLQRMHPPEFKEKVPHTHSLRIENGKKVV